MRLVKAPGTDISVVVRLVDSVDGSPEVGVVAATAGLAFNYRREGGLLLAVSAGALSDLATLDAAHTDGGILHIGNGYYRLDVRDAAFAAGSDGVMVTGGATGMVCIGCYVQLVGYDPRTELTAAVLANLDATVSSRAATGGDGDTLETLSDQLDGIDTDTTAILADTGTDGVVLKAAGLATDAVAEIADGVWDEATAGHATAGTTGKALADAGAAGDPWAAAVRTLTQTAAQTAAAVAGSTLTGVRYRTWDATLTATIQATWTAFKFTVKRDEEDSDAQALLQIIVSNPAVPATDGVLYVEGAAASVAQRTQGSLTVTQAAGTCAIHISDDLAAVLKAIDKGGYDVTQYYLDGAETKSTQWAHGEWNWELTETNALA